MPMSTTSCPAPSTSIRRTERRGGRTSPLDSWGVQRLALIAIRLYQLAVSPLLGAHCRFAPSCSAYMAAAIERYGLVAGGWRGLRRLARCHPWHAGGFDPVD